MEMDRSVEEVDAVMSFFYKTLRSRLSSLENPTVHVQNLGNFYIKEKALDATIEQYGRLLEKLDNTSFKEYGIKKTLVTEIETMRKVKEKLDEERGRRREIINKRFNNESTKEHNTDMEK
jgi:hypothetical protein